METFGKFIYQLIGIAVTPIIRGVTLYYMWDWLIVPSFDVRPLKVVETIAIMAIINYITFRFIKTDHAKDLSSIDKVTNTVVDMAFTSVFALVFAYIISLFL